MPDDALLGRMIVSHTATVRNAHEIDHGARIAEEAEDVWGWEKPTGPYRLKRRTDLMIRHAGLKPGARVLEIGCGTGVITSYLQLSGSDITAIDLSPDLLELALKKQWPDSVHFEVGNAEALSFEDGAFDAVVGSSVLHHLDIDTAIKEIHRVLKPGGTIAFSEPNMMNPHIYLQKNIPWLKRLAGDSPDETAFVRWPFKKTLESFDFTNVFIKPYDFLHPALPSSMIRSVSAFGSLLERMPLVNEIAGSLIIAGTRRT
jgi:2-polyprenyl-3-methyl-5-hydroxy-6-metoxy-1,4-benzoquinol methylase